ncbi:MAG: V-type ATP synthase subunit E [Syntrophorhabdaceae bacterium]
MSLDKIKEAVLKASRSEAAHIKAAAEKEAAEKLKSQKEDIRRELEYQFQTRSRLIEEECSRKLAQHQGAAAKDILEAKNACIRDIFKKVREIILGWSPDEYRAVMRGFLERVAKGRGGRIRVHPDDREIFAGILKEMNADRFGASALTLDEGSLHEKGGFIFMSEDYEIDSTVTTLLNEIEQGLLPEIARDLSRI